MHLANELQTELARLGSAVSLQSEAAWWAWAALGSRDIEASALLEQNGSFLQLAEKGIIIGISTSADVWEMAMIIDDWLGKRMDINAIAQAHPCIKILYNIRS